MAREPNIGGFFAILDDEDFAVEKLIDASGNSDNLQEILWYMDEDRARQISVELRKKDDKSRGRVIQNLARLYPLSRNLLYRILTDIRGSDYHFVKGFDMSRQFLDIVSSLLADIESKSGKNTRTFNDYKESVESLRRESERLRAASEQFKDLKAERDRLESEIERLKTEADAGKLNREIEELRDEERELRNRLRQLEEDHAKRHKTVNDLKNELRALESKADSGKELQLLQQLFREFPPDVEDEK